MSKQVKNEQNLPRKTKKRGKKEQQSSEADWGFPEVESDTLPKDFRQIPIFPTPAEILTNEYPHKPKTTKFRTVDHYLDIQFRRLRVDFVRPLRTAILGYGSKKPVANDVHIYQEVAFLKIEPVNEHCCVRLSLNRTVPANSRRLMYGSLVCFTRDKFKSVVFGRICQRDPDDLEKGEVVIEFSDVESVVFNKCYTMVECRVYFEPYFQVLTALQTMSSSTFPLEKYIVHLDLEPKPPKYLDHVPEPGNSLDESQLAAFRAALSQEFAIIQGPPGTGKTYLGLTIVKTLLQDQKPWHQLGPILVISYMNRALDQFLEGVLEYTDRVVRVGTRSSTGRLKRFELKAIHGDKLRHLNEISAKIKEASVILQEIDKYEGIIDFGKFGLANTWFHQASRNEIIDWLMAETEGIDHDVHREQREFLIMSLESLRDFGNQHDYLLKRLTRGKKKKEQPAVKPLADLVNAKIMKADDRWDLYFYWLKTLETSLKQALNTLILEYRVAYKEYEKVRSRESTKQLKKALVVGMTTTMAARLRACLQLLRCPIVIVEEASEVLEAHIVASLTEHCQHLILIGDHRQQKPTTVEISLLERMVKKSGNQYSVLSTQHRMRPEIASLLGTVYPFLENHTSVQDRPRIRGVDRCLFFVDYQGKDPKMNNYAISFLVDFAKYLTFNGYTPKEITILAASLDQISGFHREVAKHQELEHLRIATLEHYQGEENDIILVSLVNSEVLSDNRICVALSRARNGLFILGNLAQLCKESDLWVDIREVLLQQGNLGPELPLHCQVHPDFSWCTKTNFNMNCTRICGVVLNCGHKCKMVCHIQEKYHEEYRCEDCHRLVCDQDSRNKCQYLIQKVLRCGHQKTIKCCSGLRRIRCDIRKFCRLPCNHAAEIPCSQSLETFVCPQPCNQTLACGHTCERQCHIKADPQHFVYKCKKPCSATFKGHRCRQLCYEECDFRTIKEKKQRSSSHVHVEDVKCNRKAKKAHPRGANVVKGGCSEQVSKKSSTKKFSTKKGQLQLPCGHICSSKQPITNCPVLVHCSIPAECGHVVTHIKCHLSHLTTLPVEYCTQTCGTRLKCGHECPGNCSDCFHKRFGGKDTDLRKCTETCGVIFNCGHECKLVCHSHQPNDKDYRCGICFSKA